MAHDVLARAMPSAAEDDYNSFCDALGASERGRVFLHEYARRNRHADTEVVLAALARLEETARAQQAAPEAERIRQDLRALLDTLRAARPQIDNSPGAIKAATLASLIDFVQSRIEALILPARTSLAEVILAEVPPLEQPELPIPQPAQMPAVLALVQEAMPTSKATSKPTSMPTPRLSVTLLEPAPVEPAREPIVWAPASEIIPEVNFFDAPPAPAAVPAAEPEMPVAQKPKAAIAAEPYELWLDTDLLASASRKQPAEETETEVKAETKAKPPVTAIAALAASIAAPKPLDTSATPPAKTNVAIAALTAFAAKFEKPTADTVAQPATAASAQAATGQMATDQVATDQVATDEVDGPLALIMSMSEAERLALFT